MSPAAATLDLVSPATPDAHRRFLARRWRGAPPPAVAALHERLVLAAVGEPHAPVRRAPSISLDGTPIVYSCALGGASMPLRVLADPGGLARDVAAQGQYALMLLAGMLAELGWERAAPDIQKVVDAVVPDDVGQLHGGAWLGLAAGQRLELRLYLDLRSGPAEERWATAARALATLSPGDGAAAAASLAARVGPLGVPVGIGAVIAAGAVRGLRIYHGLEAPDRDVLVAAGAAPAMAERVCALLGPFAPQSVTAGYDFAVPAGAGPCRAKLDISLLARPHAQAIAAVDALAPDRAELWAFLDDLDAGFGGGALQYASVEPGRLTVYAQPDGHALG